MKHEKQQAAETRVEVYSTWLADDVDGLIFNATPDVSTTILAEARERVAGALAQIDNAIAADNAAHRQEHV